MLDECPKCHRRSLQRDYYRTWCLFVLDCAYSIPTVTLKEAQEVERIFGDDDCDCGYCNENWPIPRGLIVC